MDQIDSVIMTPRVGDIRTSISNVVPFGYLPMNDGTIGSASSNACTRANSDTFPLYNTIWQACNANPTYAPIYTSGGSLTTYGASAVADFQANKQLSLTKGLGQVLSGTTSVTLDSQNYTADFTTSKLTVTNAARFGTGTPVILSNSGGAAPTGLQTNYVYYAIFVDATNIKLAYQLDLAIAGTAISFTTNGTGTNSIIAYADPLGKFHGEKQHYITTDEIPPHTHPIVTSTADTTGARTNVGSGTGGPPTNIGTASNNSSTNAGMNVVQPTTYMNLFIKY